MPAIRHLIVRTSFSFILRFLLIVSPLDLSIAITLRVGLIAFFPILVFHFINIGQVDMSSGDMLSGESTFEQNNRIPNNDNRTFGQQNDKDCER